MSKLNLFKMKKIIFIVVALLVSAATYAQEAHFGVKAGMNLSNMTGDDIDGDMKAGIYLGGFVNFKLTEKFALQPELIYSQQGAKNDEGGVDEKLRTDYLNVPIMAKFYVSEGFNLQVGPQIGFLLKSEYEQDDVDVDIKDETKGVDFSLGLGCEYEMESGFGINLRYNIGLSEVYDDIDPKHSVLQIGASFKF